MDKQFDLRVVDSAIHTEHGDKHVYTRTRRSGREHYKVDLYVDGFDLPYVESVTYQLHDTFPNPTRRMRRTSANPDCRLTIWTWGLFLVGVTVHLKSGERINLDHDLIYDEEIRTAKDNELKWHNVD